MKLLVVLPILLGSLFPFASSAQKPGFYGKKFTFQFGAGGHHNTLTKLLNGDEVQFRRSSSTYNEKPYVKNNQFNYLFYGNIGLNLWKRAAFSIDFEYYSGRKINSVQYTYTDQNGFENYYTGYGQFSYSSIRIQPRINIFTRGANAPVGLTHVLGLGVEIITMKEKEFYLIPDNYGGITTPLLTTYPDINDVKPILIVPTYGLEYRHPLTKQIYLNFGAYAQLHLPVVTDNGSFLELDLIFDNYGGTPSSKVAYSRLTNLFSARAGIIFAL